MFAHLKKTELILNNWFTKDRSVNVCKQSADLLLMITSKIKNIFADQTQKLQGWKSLKDMMMVMRPWSPDASGGLKEAGAGVSDQDEVGMGIRIKK